MSTAFKSIALVCRSSDPQVAESMLSLASHLAGRGIEVLVEPAVTLDFGSERIARVPASDFAARAQLAIAVGGDGTMLYAARLVARQPVPLLGINRGRLG